MHDIFVFEHFYNFFFIFSLLQNFLTLNYIKYVALRFITDFSYVLLEFCSIFVFLSGSEQHSFDFTAQAQRADEKVGKDADEKLAIPIIHLFYDATTFLHLSFIRDAEN